MTLDARRVMQVAEACEGGGFCKDCGTEHDSIEPDATEYACEECGSPSVYGAEELLLMGLAS